MKIFRGKSSRRSRKLLSECRTQKIMAARTKRSMSTTKRMARRAPRIPKTH